MKMKKVKKFLEENPCVDAYLAGVIAATIGCAIGVKVATKDCFVVKNRQMVKLLNDAKKTYPKNFALFTGAYAKEIAPDALGKLGEGIKSLGGPENVTFTHFIAIGKPVK